MSKAPSAAFCPCVRLSQHQPSIFLRMFFLADFFPPLPFFSFCLFSFPLSLVPFSLSLSLYLSLSLSVFTPSPAFCLSFCPLGLESVLKDHGGHISCTDLQNTA